MAFTTQEKAVLHKMALDYINKAYVHDFDLADFMVTIAQASETQVRNAMDTWKAERIAELQARNTAIDEEETNNTNEINELS